MAVQPPAVAVQPVSGPRYGSSIRNALHTGQQRDLLCYCIPGGDWDTGPSTDSCGSPHAVEVLGIGYTGELPVSRTQLELTCRRLVRQLTGIPDPTVAGALVVQVHVEDGSNTVVTAAQVPANSSAKCGVAVTGDRKLGGSLLALGRQPIPWR